MYEAVSIPLREDTLSNEIDDTLDDLTDGFNSPKGRYLI